MPWVFHSVTGMVFIGLDQVCEPLECYRISIRAHVLTKKMRHQTDTGGKSKETWEAEELGIQKAHVLRILQSMVSPLLLSGVPPVHSWIHLHILTCGVLYPINFHSC
jgi:hypothetical protein